MNGRLSPKWVDFRMFTRRYHCMTRLMIFRRAWSALQVCATHLRSLVCFTKSYLSSCMHSSTTTCSLIWISQKHYTKKRYEEQNSQKVVTTCWWAFICNRAILEPTWTFWPQRCSKWSKSSAIFSNTIKKSTINRYECPTLYLTKCKWQECSSLLKM